MMMEHAHLESPQVRKNWVDKEEIQVVGDKRQSNKKRKKGP